MTFGLIYVGVSILLASVIIIGSDGDYKHLFTEMGDIIVFAVLTVTWPIAFLTLIIIGLLEFYKHRVFEKVRSNVYMIRDDYTTIEQINIKDLKYILFATKIGAIHVDDKLINKVKQSISDRSFEDHLLSSK